jgi:hypothetical protein
MFKHVTHVFIALDTRIDARNVLRSHAHLPHPPRVIPISSHLPNPTLIRHDRFTREHEDIHLYPSLCFAGCNASA